MTAPTACPPVSGPEANRAAARPPLGFLERSTVLRVVVLMGGLVLPQVLLFGPSLIGRKILLPLGILAKPPAYLPRSQAIKVDEPRDKVLSDLVLTDHPARVFSAEEWRAGRLPLWDPLSYAGAPFAVFGKYCPFELLYVAFPFPVTLAWIQLLKSVVAGLGAYCFFRGVLGVRAPAALVGAWCYPLSGFFMLWQGSTITYVVAWFPWLLLATWGVVRRPAGWWGPILAVLTAFSLLGGHIDIAAQALAGSGVFALWALFDRYGRSGLKGKIPGVALALVAAWAVGLALAAPYWLPLVEYAGTGQRMLKRLGGHEDHPPAGLAVLPQTVLPLFYGSSRLGRAYVGGSGNLLESGAGAFTGLVATLLAAPLAWCGRHRRQALFWLGLALVTLAWHLDVPGLVALMRLPGMNMVSHNRSVFVTSFALLTLAVCGFDELTGRMPEPRWWFAVPAGLLVLLGGACVLGYAEPTDHLADRIEQQMRALGYRLTLQVTPEAEQRFCATFVNTYFWGMVLCGVALAGWASIAVRWPVCRWLLPAAALVTLAELLAFAWDLNPQFDPSLYYPRLPILEQLARLSPDRILAVDCLWADLHKSHGLREVRGYDSVDPRGMLELLELARDRKGPQQASNYAVVLAYTPALTTTPDHRFKIPPVLDMLNVRYLLFYGPRPDGVRPLLEWEDYWTVENPNVLPRAYVPRRVVSVAAGKPTLDRLAAKGFDPRQEAYVAEPVELPESCSGQAEITAEKPCQVEVAVDMRTAGLLVLADQWYAGWQATVDGRPAPVLRTNHALRGVPVPAGRSLVCLRYRPMSLTNGICLFAAGLLGLLAWAGRLVMRRSCATGDVARAGDAPVH